MQLPLTSAPAIQRLNARVKRQPILNAFCRVAPSVRLSLFAMFPALVLLRASVFSVRTSAVDHARLLVAFFMMSHLPKLFV